MLAVSALWALHTANGRRLLPPGSKSEQSINGLRSLLFRAVEYTNKSPRRLRQSQPPPCAECTLRFAIGIAILASGGEYHCSQCVGLGIWQSMEVWEMSILAHRRQRLKEVAQNLVNMDVHFVLRQPPNCPQFRLPPQNRAVARVCRGGHCRLRRVSVVSFGCLIQRGFFLEVVFAGIGRNINEKARSLSDLEFTPHAEVERH